MERWSTVGRDPNCGGLVWMKSLLFSAEKFYDLWANRWFRRYGCSPPVGQSEFAPQNTYDGRRNRVPQVVPCPSQRRRTPSVAGAEGAEIYFRGCPQSCLLRHNASHVPAHIHAYVTGGGTAVVSGLWMMLWD